MHCLFSVYFVNQPLHVSGIFVAHHQRYTVYIQHAVYIQYTTRVLHLHLGTKSHYDPFSD
jgi:hypothetical protein